jgi:hypothetical protein
MNHVVTQAQAKCCIWRTASPILSGETWYPNWMTWTSCGLLESFDLYGQKYGKAADLGLADHPGSLVPVPDPLPLARRIAQESPVREPFPQ